MAKTYMQSANGEVFETSHPEYHKECENLGGGSKGFAARQEYCRKELRKILKPKSTVYTVLRSVSKSGMSREISAFAIQKGELRNLDCLVADAIGYVVGPHGIKMHGCGMDMGFALVHSLGAALWPKGTAKPHSQRNGEPDREGGYALKRQWL